MKFTLNWLKDHIETTATLDEICTTLTKIGLEVEDLHNPAALLTPFTVAHIDSTVKHPNADKLKVCTVDTGSEKLQIVCGAPNARAGIKVVLSRPGDFIPGLNITLGASKIRDVESQGMLCALDELGLGDDHAGIMELPADAPVGAKFLDVMPHLADPVIEINLTPNRGDCAGVRGVARDLAAAGLGTLKALAAPQLKNSGPSGYKVVVENPADCPAFTLRLIKGVKNGPSPDWLQQRLKAIGITPISALVDVTNYFTIDRARPLHVFDAAKVTGTTLTIRRAKSGETIMALNNKEYNPSVEHTVIADGKGLESIGGIMGGLHSGCDENTTDVLVECAWFDPVGVAKTGRELNIISDARYRFERGIDPMAIVAGADAAAAMIIELCGGTPSDIGIVGAEQPNKTRIHYFPDHVKRLGGIDVDAATQQKLFTALGCDVHQHGDHFDITPPSWRHDLTQAQDLVEEVLRLTGYDAIPPVALPDRHMTTALNPGQRRAFSTRRILAGRGLAECITFSFMPKALAAEFGQINPALTLVNPISADLDQMRPSALGNLLQAAAGNSARGYPNSNLFEVGPNFSKPGPDGEERVATGLRSGPAQRHWQKQTVAADAFAAKADAMTLLEQFGLNPDTLPVTAEAPHYYHPGRSGVVRLGTNVIAAFGEIHPSVAEACGLYDRAVGFEVFIDRLPAAKSKSSAKVLLQLPPLMPVRRDFAFVVTSDVTADKLVKAVKQADKALITDVSVFDVYQGDKIEAGKKSVAVAVTLQPQGDKAFAEADLEKLSNAIVAAAAKAGAVLR